jgi:hypothetical protein
MNEFGSKFPEGFSTDPEYIRLAATGYTFNGIFSTSLNPFCFINEMPYLYYR